MIPQQLMRTQSDGALMVTPQGNLPRRDGFRKRWARQVDRQTSRPMEGQDLPPLSCRGTSTRGRRWRSSVWWPPLRAARLRKMCRFGGFQWSTDPEPSPSSLSHCCIVHLLSQPTTSGPELPTTPCPQGSSHGPGYSRGCCI